MFETMTEQDLDILYATLNSGWRKQAAVYEDTREGPGYGGTWRETEQIMHDLHSVMSERSLTTDGAWA